MTTDKTNEKDTEEKLERMWDGFKKKALFITAASAALTLLAAVFVLRTLTGETFSVGAAILAAATCFAAFFLLITLYAYLFGLRKAAKEKTKLTPVESFADAKAQLIRLGEAEEPRFRSLRKKAAAAASAALVLTVIGLALVLPAIIRSDIGRTSFTVAVVIDVLFSACSAAACAATIRWCVKELSARIRRAVSFRNFSRFEGMSEERVIEYVNGNSRD